jgi:O-antigen/teichoic acid export membrane protein
MVGSVISGMFTRVAVAILNFVILVISSRYLGPATRGEISLYLLNIGLVQLVNEIYTGYSLVHFIPRSGFNKVLTAGLLFTALVCPATYVVLLLAGTSVRGYEIIGFVTCLLVVLNTFNCVLLLGREKVREFNLLSLLQPALLLAGMSYTIVARDEFVFSAFCWPLLFSFAVAFCWSAWLVARLPGDGRRHFSVYPVLLNGFIYQAATILFLLSNRFSYFLLEDKKELGIYSAAVSIMDAALVLSAGLAPVLLSRVANRGAPEESARLSLSLAKTSLLLTVLVALVILLLPDAVFVMVLGTGFSPVREVMLCYVPGMLLLSFITAISAYFTACGRQKYMLWAYAAGFTLTLCLAPALVRNLGMKGAALSAGLSYLVAGFVITSLFLRTSRISRGDFFAWKPDLARLQRALKNEEGA